MRDLPSWLSDYSVKFAVNRIGIAFPLALDGNPEVPHLGGVQQPHVRAFLFSIKSSHFSVERNGSGVFSMQSFSFQFVDRFVPSRETQMPPAYPIAVFGNRIRRTS